MAPSEVGYLYVQALVISDVQCMLLSSTVFRERRVMLNGEVDSARTLDPKAMRS